MPTETISDDRNERSGKTISFGKAGTNNSGLSKIVFTGSLFSESKKSNSLG
jgi:hypothetical protein